MRRIFGVFLLIPIYFLIMLFLYNIRILNYEQEAIEEFRLKKAVNYCVDAATAEMLEVSNLGMDYKDWGKINVDPELAKEAFSNTFCLNYDMKLTEANRNEIENYYIKLFTVCAYDGYYVYQSKCVNEEGDYKLVSLPKLPYTYKVGGSSYALNLGLKSGWRYSNNKISYVDVPISKKEQLSVINSRLSSHLTKVIDEQYQRGWTSELFIPNELTEMSGTNPVDRPSVLVVLSDIDIITSNRVKAFGIGGAKVTNARSVAAYVRNGRKYYSYADLLPEDIYTATNPNGTKTFIENMYMTIEEAAEAGYYCDTYYMN